MAHAEDWVVLKNSPTGCSTLVAFDEKTVLCVRYNDGNLLDVPGLSKTTDGGEKWTTVNQPLMAPYAHRSLYWRDASMALLGVVGGSGTPGTDLLWKTTDGGEKWALKSLSTPLTYLRLYGGHCAGTACYVGGQAGDPTSAKPVAFLARSTDGGDTWTKVGTPMGPPGFVASVWTFDANTVWIQTDAGGHRSIDGGATWTPGGPGVSYVYGGWTKFVDPKNGYATGGGKLAKTADGGASWMAVGLPTPTAGKGSMDVRVFDFIDAQYGFAGLSYNTNLGEVARTSNAGVAWTNDPTPTGFGPVLGPPPNNGITGVAMASKTVGYASGGLLKGSSGGNSVIRWGTPSATTTDAGVDAAPMDGAVDALVTDAPKADDALAADSAPVAGGDTGDGGGCGVARDVTDRGTGLIAAGLALLAVLRARRQGTRSVRSGESAG